MEAGSRTSDMDVGVLLLLLSRGGLFPGGVGAVKVQRGSEGWEGGSRGGKWLGAWFLVIPYGLGKQIGRWSLRRTECLWEYTTRPVKNTRWKWSV